MEGGGGEGGSAKLNHLGRGGYTPFCPWPLNFIKPNCLVTAHERDACLSQLAM